MPISDENTLLFYSKDLPTDLFFLCSLQGSEALSRLYEMHVLVQTDAPLEDADITSLMTKPATIALDRTEEDKIFGVIRSVEMIPQHDARVTRYLLTMVPRLWYLTQTTRSRVFLDKSIVDIVKDVLNEAGLEETKDYAVSVTGTYAVRDFVVQFEETDFAFISRLMENDGIFYWFDHSGEAGEKMVIADKNSAVTALAGHETVQFMPGSGAVDTGQSVYELRRQQQTIPKQVFMRDFNFELPATVPTNASAVEVDAAGWPADRVGHGLVVPFGENIRDASDASRLGKIRAEELLARKVVYLANSGVRGFHVGHKYTLENHLIGSLDKEYLITELSHFADQEGLLRPEASDGAAGNGYHNEFEAIEVATQFRPQRLTPRPRIHGLIHALIDGKEQATRAPIDDKGRYRVVMPYDTVAKADTKTATLPIRLAQSYAGPNYGIHFPLHQGVEVLIGHVQGDPDRPVIVGAVPNPTQASPVLEPDATRSRIVSRSQIRIEWDDDA